MFSFLVIFAVKIEENIVEVIDLVEVGIISASNSDAVWTKIEMISSDLIGDFELIFLKNRKIENWINVLKKFQFFQDFYDECFYW